MPCFLIQAVLNLSNVTTIDKNNITSLIGKIVLHQKLTSNQVNEQNIRKDMYLLQAYSETEKSQSELIKIY